MTDQERSKFTDRELGMDRAIPRRDFLNGAATTIGAALLPEIDRGSRTNSDEPQNRTGYNPPTSVGLRGSHSGSFEIAHSLRDGTFWKNAAAPERVSEKYDLIIVGAESAPYCCVFLQRTRRISSKDSSP